MSRPDNQAKRFKEAAELYEEVSPLVPTTAAWNYKEDTAAWLKEGSKDKVIKLAKQSGQATPETRNKQLGHFFHGNLGDPCKAWEKWSEAGPAE